MKSGKKKKTNFIAIFLLVSFTLMGTVLAKYATERKKEELYTAGAFYFESDLLTENSNLKNYTYQEGINNIEIEIKNNIDDLRFSEVDIYYKVTITDLEGENVIDKEENEVPEFSGKLTKGKIDSCKVNFNNLKTGSYIVTATSTLPYEKTIKANFVITDKNNDINYEAKDAINSPVVQLTISNKDYDGNIKISWPEGTTPDNTNLYFLDNNTQYNGGSKIINFSSNAEYIIQFFKEDLNTKYTTSDFNVERSD